MRVQLLYLPDLDRRSLACGGSSACIQQLQKFVQARHACSLVLAPTSRVLRVMVLKDTRVCKTVLNICFFFRGSPLPSLYS